MKFKDSEDKKRDVRIEISPLIDVVFLLLIFFLVSTTFIQDSGLNLDLPESTVKESGKKKSVIVKVNSEGDIHYKGNKISVEELSGKISQDIKETKNKTVVIKADTDSAHGRVVEVMGLVKENGAKGVTIATKEKK